MAATQHKAAADENMNFCYVVYIMYVVLVFVQEQEQVFFLKGKVEWNSNHSLIIAVLIRALHINLEKQQSLRLLWDIK